ncbi:MAG TPA: SPOR domain-containing protein [Steroidobacteraceae bacterium]|nr:SPOR domain-containing protein [Steroidobacteraceae bacterium]
MKSAANRLSARDFKKPARPALEATRWRDFGAGLLVGAVLVAGVYAAAHRPQRAASEVPRPEPHRPAPADAAAADPAGQGAERYDFYQMLPHFEVIVPEKERDVKRDVPTATIARPGVYVLQAGSYRDAAEADRVAKQLALQGIDAKVQRVAVDTDVWYRVRIGPISQLSDLNRLRKKLYDADVDAIVIRVGD